MTKKQSEAAKKRYRRDFTRVCPTCQGKGEIRTPDVHTRAKQAGIATVRASLQPGGRPMGERNQGRPKNPTIADLDRMGL